MFWTSSPAHLTTSRPPEGCLAACKPRPCTAHSRWAVLPSVTRRTKGPRGTGCPAPAVSRACRQRVFQLVLGGPTSTVLIYLRLLFRLPHRQRCLCWSTHTTGKLTTSQNGKRVRVCGPADPYSHKLQPPPINGDWFFFTRQYSGWSNG